MKKKGQNSARCIGLVARRRSDPRTRAWRVLQMAFPACLLLSVLGCSQPPRPGFVFTQSPATNSSPPLALDVLDLRYPAGSRVILADLKFKRLEVLSEGLFSAGDPQITYDGKRVLFCAKATPRSQWQIYESELGRRGHHPLTSIPGGTADPTLLPDGRVLFVSPVRRLGGTNSDRSVLYAQMRGEPPKALTFTSVSISDPGVLDDGRILFVGTRTDNGRSTCALYTINNDGTEISEFSRPQVGPAAISRPRQVGGNRIIYLVSEAGSGCGANRVEFIRCARPFATPETLGLGECDRVGSVQAAGDQTLLLSAAGPPRAAPRPSLALYLVDLDRPALGQALFSDPAWDSFEASKVASSSPPMGRLSTVDPTKTTGQILCLNVNYTYDANTSFAPATRVRVVAEPIVGKSRVLGEVPVQVDGSFLAEVPADVPLGLEALDERGQMVRRLAPMIWVRPGENRACIGCHEPRNHAPGNHRPLAVRAPVPRLTLDNQSLTQARR